MKHVILVIGGGSIGKRHLKNLRSLNYKNLFCLKRKQDKSFEKKYACKVITSFAEIEKFNINILIICSPTSLHLNSIQYGISNQCHIFVEKPLTHDIASLDKVCKLLDDNKKVFFIGYMLRYHPAVKKIKEILDSEELGKVYSSFFQFGSFLPNWHPEEDYKLSYASNKNLGGGVINTISHEVDMMQYFFGKPNYVFCQKMNSNILSIDAEEHCKAIFSYTNHLSSLHLDYLQKDYHRSVRILLENGKLEWNWNNSQLKIKNYKNLKENFIEYDLDINSLYLDELIEFFKLINSDTINHELDDNHAILNTQILLSMHESSEKKEAIKL